MSQLIAPPRVKQLSDHTLHLIDKFRHLYYSLDKWLVLSGAGVSTEGSRIPDYRTSYKRLQQPQPTPITYQKFVASPQFRQRYWARSTIGWPKIRDAKCSAVHKCISSLQQPPSPPPSSSAAAAAAAASSSSASLSKASVTGIITQNVDSLHHKAGSRNIIELHGTLQEVICLQCRHHTSRHEHQHRLLHMNPHIVDIMMTTETMSVTRPDGDVALADEHIASFNTPACERCGDGILKPKLVFFGENVPKPVVSQARQMVEECDGVLVVGTSLAVYSGYRFVEQAKALNKPIVIITDGETRGDGIATMKMNGNIGQLLQHTFPVIYPHHDGDGDGDGDDGGEIINPILSDVSKQITTATTT